MDPRGSVDLRVVSRQFQVTPIQQDQRDELRHISSSYDGHALDHLRTQLVCLHAAAVLQNYLLHLRHSRLARFEIPRHPDAITLGQLAHLRRTQPGVAGQSFEIAIADSVNAGVPAVIDPIRSALRLLNIPHHGPIGMVLLGLEKVRPDDRQAVYDLVAQQLPSTGRLRGGGAGRPATAATVLARLSELNWHSMREDERQGGADAALHARARVSQLGRADALLYCGDAIVPVSMKIRGTGVDLRGWRDVPLWVTTTTLARSDAIRSPLARCPTAVVRLARSEFYTSVFLSTVDAVDTLLAALDLGQTPVRPMTVGARLLLTRLRPFVDRPLSEALDYLRGCAHPGVSDVLNGMVHAEGTVITMPLLNNETVQQAYTSQALDRQLFTVQNHLWVPSHLAA